MKFKRVVYEIAEGFFSLLAVMCTLVLSISILSVLTIGLQTSNTIALIIALPLFFLSILATKRIRSLKSENGTFLSITKEFGVFFIVSFSVTAALWAMLYYVNLFPAEIEKNLRVEIYKTIIQTNGFLIGLSGVVFAQMFWAIHSYQNSIQIMISDRPAGYNNISKKDSRADALTALNKKRTMMTVMLFVVIFLFLFSILSSISQLARTQIYSTDFSPVFPDLSYPLIFMVLAISMLSLFVANSKIHVEDSKD